MFLKLFDLNPVENGNGLKLNISLTDNVLEPSMAFSVAKEFSSKSFSGKRNIQIHRKICFRIAKCS
jgi:hypothetical protein